jgi:hypothetical protein
MRKILALGSINLVFTSSYSSQLGFLISQSFQRSNTRLYSSFFREFFLIFAFPCASDPFVRNYIPASVYDSFTKIYPSRPIFHVVRVRSYFHRLLLSTLFYPTILLASVFEVVLWQPRPLWAKQALTIPKTSVSLLPSFFPCIYFGDGFLNSILTPSPFWLKKQKVSSAPQCYPLEKSIGAFYAFDISGPKPPLSSKVDSSYLVNTVANIINDRLDTRLSLLLDQFLPIFESCGRILLFPSTTFFETGRSSLDSEISLYHEYLCSLLACNFTHIMIKPHPGACIRKNTLFLDFLRSDRRYGSSQIISSECFSADFPLSHIPLELIVFYLSTHICAFDNLFLVGASTAALSVKLMFPQINIVPAFGRHLLSKHISPDFLSARLHQEALLEDSFQALE